MYIAAQAILVGTLYWLSMECMSYFIPLAFREPVVLSVSIGLIYGDVQASLLYGATIQLMYMGGIEADEDIPSDQGLITYTTIPAAIANNLDPAAAVALAVPLGILGVSIDDARRITNSSYNTKADKFIEDKRYDRLSIFSFVLPWLISSVLYFILVFIAILFGSSVTQAFINVTPGWVMNGLANAGNMLPGLGFTLALVVMRKKEYLPFLVLGFFLYSVMGLPMLTGTVIALYLILIISLFKQSDEGEVA